MPALRLQQLPKLKDGVNVHDDEGTVRGKSIVSYSVAAITIHLQVFICLQPWCNNPNSLHHNDCCLRTVDCRARCSWQMCYW